MSEETNVVADNSNTAEEVVLETTEAETVEESVEEVKAKLAKAEELANNYKVRAEKAEKSTKEVKAPIENKKSEGLSLKDALALLKANVPDDDISEVEDYAKFKGISVSEALKSSVIKNLLNERSEQRTVAQATNTSNSRRTVSKVTDEVLLEKAHSGNLPESDEDIKRLMKARIGKK